MDTHMRRERLEMLLKESNEPITGSRLASIFDVSRQIIVGDIAILRARGLNIIATPQGYFIPEKNEEDIFRDIIVSRHFTFDELEDELLTIVDNGGKILDVIVDHSVYGELRAVINISSRKDAEEFIERLKGNKALPMSSLTNGIHLHTIETKDENTFNGIVEKLKTKGYLLV
ncbi:3H domain-containing protein [Peptoclostridium acidaminophilum DSM 3953]|uniref:3H domain-containing protein n=1 Tax=Peptoclostridium acidaminophilum DSM 3953 TaxID=1286171 RepID=W8T3H7_PEPAC|nr:transcription repressor NadR [Peptoclostridium acidaminophilum]AHM55385.1 3H domain-containing protein [Peptoclostridium acidaminophilum DSM 3953]